MGPTYVSTNRSHLIDQRDTFHLSSITILQQDHPLVHPAAEEEEEAVEAVEAVQIFHLSPWSQVVDHQKYSKHKDR